MHMVGQSFLGNGQNLPRAGFRLLTDGRPVRHNHAYLYAHTGTFGTTGTGTGDPLATSITSVDTPR